MNTKTAPLVLRTLRPEDELSFREALREFRLEEPAWDFALGFEEALGFAEYLRRLDAVSRGEKVPAGFVPATFYVGVVDDVVVGRLSLRHELNEFLARIGGHIGYGVRPSQRARGYATEMLRQAIPLSAARGITHALITCDVDNVASRKVIERCGGVLESITCDPSVQIQKRRYWLRTA